MNDERLLAEIEGLRAQLALMREHADELRYQRDAWQNQVEIAQRPLVDQHPPVRSGGNAPTIFLVLFVLLCAGVGGAGFWAWREGFVNFDTMSGRR